MTTINLKDFYYWYIVDELVEVPDEVAEVLLASRRNEAALKASGGTCSAPTLWATKAVPQMKAVRTA